MAWPGWFEYAGTEIVNVARVEAYAKNLSLGWFKSTYKNDALPLMLGDVPYGTPLSDDAPWLDPVAPESMDFLGLYPLDVSGLEDSTITATVVESLTDGGVVQRPRRATRTVVFAAALIGLNDCAVEYGLRWLRDVLAGGPCGGVTSCGGGTMCYLACEPALPVGASGDLTQCLDPLLRNLRRVSNTTGPTVTGKFTMPSGGCAWTVSWTVVAGTPYEFMVEQPLVTAFTADATDFYVDPTHTAGLPFDTVGVTTDEYPCLTPVYRPFYDPDCPLVLPPPPLPNISASCFNFPTQFVRRFFTIPRDQVPLYGVTVPMITFKAGPVATRNLRLRFYADVVGSGDPSLDPCSYCGDIVFSYIPANSTLVFDGSDRVVTIATPGQPLRRADAVVFKSNGTPFDWPELSCGYDYLTVVDMPTEQDSDDPPTMPSIDLALVGKVA